MPSSARSQFVAAVRANRPLCREHYRLTLAVPEFPPTAPGQFIQVACRDLDAPVEPAEVEWSPRRPLDVRVPELLGPTAMLRRPFSLAGRRDLPSSAGGGVELDIIHRVVGVGTEWLSVLRPGDPVFILGPLGNVFRLTGDGHDADTGSTTSIPTSEAAPSRAVRARCTSPASPAPPASPSSSASPFAAAGNNPAPPRAILVAGGVGIPPMLYLAEHLAGYPSVAFCGATTADLLPLTIRATKTTTPTADHAADATPPYAPAFRVEEFTRHGIPAVITTDDGSLGFRGFVTQALERYLDALAPALGKPVLYTCGPEPMMKRVADIAAARGLECQIAVERAMACGMGTCQSCCIKVRKPDPAAPPMVGSDWSYRLACTDGPVFRGADLLW